MLLGVLFAGTGDDLQLGIHCSRSKNDVDVNCVSRGSRDETFSVFDPRLTQDLLVSGIASLGKPALVAIAFKLGLVSVDHDKRHGFARQLARYTATYASCTANDVML